MNYEEAPGMLIHRHQMKLNKLRGSQMQKFDRSYYETQMTSYDHHINSLKANSLNNSSADEIFEPSKAYGDSQAIRDS